jgi:hypothetical protein
MAIRDSLCVVEAALWSREYARCRLPASFPDCLFRESAAAAHVHTFRAYIDGLRVGRHLSRTLVVQQKELRSS